MYMKWSRLINYKLKIWNKKNQTAIIGKAWVSKPFIAWTDWEKTPNLNLKIGENQNKSLCYQCHVTFEIFSENNFIF